MSERIFDATWESPSPSHRGAKTEELRRWDHAHFWHPFTQMKDWCASEVDPLILVSGRGAVVTDSNGKDYIDGNSSIWTNIHGHGHPKITAAIHEQLDRIAHTSALGFSNEASIRLARRLVEVAPGDSLSRVFYTDDGSTAIECACRMAAQYRSRMGEEKRQYFVTFQGAYHGDTVGAASLGGIPAFSGLPVGTGYPIHRIGSLTELAEVDGSEVNAVVIEPLIQGAAGMRLWPSGMLRELRRWCDKNDVFLILDEVMTGFGRTGKLFACQHEDVVPDFLCLAKGLTGGYLPLAATLTTDRVFSAFLGDYEEMRTFFYGHSYCGNALGCAAALASLRVFEEEKVFEKLPRKIACLRQGLEDAAKKNRNFGEIRQIGMIAAIDLIDAETGGLLDWREEMGAKICRRARGYGLLTRPVRDTLVLMPPLCIEEDQIFASVEALDRATQEILK